MSEMQPFPQMLKRLHRLAEKEAAHSGCDPANAFSQIGLILHEHWGNFAYSETIRMEKPLNASTFASAGEDFVEYSLLHMNGEINDASPVVMTAPMTVENPNVIVGVNLRDFLCLGCQLGYTGLDQLTFAWTDTIQDLLHPEQVFLELIGKDYAAHPDYQEEMRLLLLLKEEFGLAPWAE